ncbi:MAG: AAA family ATPase [Fibromonadaceae bacterium]|nr:AAA family ATPase [Fibromonadaceae bacterium]
MKILQLRFKNINSLAGYQELDFTKPEFTEAGIFAITGKTGSGKSSILDAISLALYGKTPRIEVTGSSNEVMTRGEKDCFSEVVFESKGKKWKAAWKQELSKTGNLKQIERSIADENNKIIADKASEAGKKIVEILGLNFEQFTKVILLAQGSFAAFLQAGKDEKGELLEQITGTKIYGDISKKVFERNKLESQKLEKINIEIIAIKTFSEEEIRTLQNEALDLEKQKTAMDNELQALEQIFEKVKTLNLVLEEIKNSEAKTKNSEKELAANEEYFNKAKQELQIKLTLQATRNQEMENKKAEASKILNGKDISYYHNEKEGIIGFGKEISNLANNIKEIISSIAKIKENNKIIAESSAKAKELEAKTEGEKKILEAIENNISLLQENIKFAERIRSLEEQRKTLKDGEECPLCGAREHPFAKRNIPQTDEKENELKNKKQQLKDLSKQISSEEKILEKLKSDKSNAQKNNQETENKINENRNKTEQILLELGQFDCKISEDENCISKLEIIRKQKINEYKIIDEVIKEAGIIEKDIRTLRDGEVPKISSEIDEKKNEINSLQTKIATLKASIKERQEQINIQKTKVESFEKEKIFEKKPFEELQAEYKEKKKKTDELLRASGAKKQLLESNNLNLEKSKQKIAEKERQQITSDKWKRLDNLIGSADGKKFRNYAQALTFENLIALTNKQLQKMSERYVLKRVGDLANPFELLVIDKFQNCAERTAQNLSGGEKFIVSLSLALGLANMASHNMRIDTMFIDEGFGTLDSDYLDVALTALSNLQSEGKLIGVISHLSELKERIATHIAITPVGNGKSRIL